MTKAKEHAVGERFEIDHIIYEVLCRTHPQRHAHVKVDPQAAAAASGEEDITEGGDNQGGGNNNNPPSGELEG